MGNHNSYICLNKFFQEALSQLLTSGYWLLLSYKFFQRLKILWIQAQNCFMIKYP